MTIVETTTYICDKCGKDSPSMNFNNGSEEGSLIVLYSGHRGAVTYAGDWGGNNIKNKKLLCFDCSDKFIKFFEKEGGKNDAHS